MVYANYYQSKLNCADADEVFIYFLNTLKPSNMIWSYFVNWDKVFRNAKKAEIALNTLNYLIGKENFDEEFTFLVKEHPEVVEVLPALVVRINREKNDKGNWQKQFKILVDFSSKKLVYEDFDFSKREHSVSDIEKYLRFMKETGVLELLESKRVKNLVDYIIGVEAGLDSNARKNRGGDAMEDIVEVFVADLCARRGWRYLRQANAATIKLEYGYDVPVDKSSRRYDFAINTGSELALVETNFYAGGGSKLKATVGEYINLANILKGKYRLIWITDGLGWHSAARPLHEAFNNNDHVLNLSMLEVDILEDILIN
jgi:type II restriction enzyme